MNPVLQAICRIGSGLLVGVATATAGVHPVPATSTGLSHALAMAQPGDTLLLAEGNHRAVGLHLPDGLTLIGQGTGARFEGRGGQPFFIVQDATNGVQLQNLVLHGARSRESGGAIRANRSRLVLDGVTIEECRSKHAGGALYAKDCHVALVDCRFLDNRADQGGAIALEAGDMSSPSDRLIADNVLFAGNRARKGGAIDCEVPATVTHGTFAGNEVEGTDAHGSAIRARSSLELLMCNLVDNRGGNPGNGPVSYSKDDTLLVSYTNIHGNSGGVGSGDPVASRTGKGNLSVAPRFVDADIGDFRLRWNSPLLDAGTGTLEFDLTLPDIGWKPSVSTHQISGTVSTDLEAHNYEIIDNCTITGTIPPGATIRTNSGVVLEIQVPASGVQYMFGDWVGPRTAIVGRPDPDLESASSISFVARAESSPLWFQGVLFNYPAVSNAVGELRFNSQYAPINYSIHLDGDRVQFMNYSNFTVGGGSNTVIDANLAFWYSRGTVSNLDFRTVEGDPARLQLFNSAMTVQYCDFTPSTTELVTYSPPLQVFGMLNGETSHLLYNTFHGGEAQLGPLAHVTQSVQRAQRNQFLDCYTTALRQDFATMDLSQEGRNSFYANAGFDPEMPMVIMDDGDLDLYCGRNNFVVQDAYPEWPIITYTQRFYPGMPHRNWRQNFFGRATCDENIPDQELLEDDVLPAWVVLESSLSECVSDTAPEDPRCEYPAITSYQLLKDGINAETAQDYETARGNYFYLLALYPDSKETNEATLRLKALGLSEDFGSMSYEAIRGDLHSVADSSEAVPQHSLAVLQVASGWCVEAMYGDRPAAISSLEAAYAAETDSKCRTILSLALAEIATYPVQGGMSATGPEVRYARALVQQSAVQALFALQQAETTGADPEVSSVMPQTFAIERVYPNPFNPTTTIELALPTEGLLKLQVYNLLGQSVATVVEERLEAGLHVIRFDGSSLASGMYLAVAEFEGQSQVRKMLLMK